MVHLLPGHAHVFSPILQGSVDGQYAGIGVEKKLVAPESQSQISATNLGNGNMLATKYLTLVRHESEPHFNQLK